jgi:transketolase
LPADWATIANAAIQSIAAAPASKATRKASLDALNALAPALPELIGGSADLTGSNLTRHTGSETINAAQSGGNYIYFGVREFAMVAITNGIALHGGFIPYAGTFLTFSDYARNAVRMAALMGIRNIQVFTHDSIGLGEDGPTHQPIEHLASLQLIPNLRVWRPCDGVETIVAWRDAIEDTAGPTSLVLTRQSLPPQPRSDEQLALIRRGGYVLSGDESPDIIFIATGSEVAVVVEAAQTVSANGHSVRVVSMPCVSAFLAQDDAYRETVLPSNVGKRIAVEAGSPDLWYRFVGPEGRVIGLDGFGASAPGADLFRHFGLTAERVTESALKLLND